MDTKKMLLEFSALDAISGREGPATDYARTLLESYGAVEITPLGSVVCAVRPPKKAGPHLLLDAHIDEIGLVVTAIEEGGFLRVAPCGGVDRRILSAAPVTIHGQEGPMSGVVCSIPPHLSGDGEKKNLKVEDIHIDVGLTKEDAERVVFPGDMITLQSSPRELLGDLVSGKALDDRAGCVSLLKALEYLKGAELDCGLTVVFSSQEEVGGAGARTASYQVAPTHAIAVDVSFAHTPDADREKCGDLKKGPMIGFSPILSNSMSRKLVAVATAEDIPFQYEVMGSRTGTNADQIATARAGVVTALVSIPQKYMHTPIETVSVGDVENTGRLIAAYIKSEWGKKA